jgi:hypothetical protein
MAANMGTVPGSLLGEMECLIPQTDLGQLIAGRADGEVSGQQAEDAAARLTSDLSVLFSMIWMGRKQEMEKSAEPKCEEKMKPYKRGAKDMKKNVRIELERLQH